MTIPTEPAALVTHFAEPAEARRFVAELRRAGFRGREVGVVAPQRELLASQTLIGAAFGAPCRGIRHLSPVPTSPATCQVSILLEINAFLGVALAGAIARGRRIVPEALVAMLVPPGTPAIPAPDLAGIEQTLVVVETQDPARQSRPLRS